MSRPVSCSRAAQRSINSASGSSRPHSDSTCSSSADRRGFDAIGLLRIDVVALLHGAHAAHARVLVGEAAHEVVQQSLAHGAFGHPDPVDAEVLDDLQQDREPRGKHRRALGIHVLEIQLIDVTRGDDALGEQPQVVERDARRVGIEPAQDVADDAHRAGAAERLQPAELAIGLLDRLELEPDRRSRTLEALLGDSAVVEIAGGQAHAADRQALEQQAD